MQKHYFELDKIESITLTSESETDYRWFPEIPAKEKSFMGIKYGMTKAIAAGWNDMYENADGTNEWQSWKRKQASHFDRFESYRVCDITKRIYRKAHVEVRIGYKQSFGLRFDNNTEAQAWVDMILSSTDKQLGVIINN
jgi:hypothetical protein